MGKVRLNGQMVAGRRVSSETTKDTGLVSIRTGMVMSTSASGRMGCDMQKGRCRRPVRARHSKVNGRMAC